MQKQDQNNKTNDNLASEQQEKTKIKSSNEETIKSEKNNDQKSCDTQIQDLQAKIQDLKEKLLRNLAEMENFRNRSEKTLVETKEYSISNFAKDLIVVMDSLNMSLIHKAQKPQLEIFERVMEGVEITQKQLSNVFSKYKITIIAPKEGDLFDYNNHFAISQNDNSNQKAGTIVTVMQVGYKIGNRILRPASVVVAKSEDS
ncbi:MAG: nucleotide exchange factor GrpE [Rickettsia sp.]|nr:nucleotide exchange factor GrpE [Rickettsia sp.]